MGDPVFVLSAPRSGSTLLGTLLGMHPMLANAGEANFANVLSSMYEAELITRNIDPSELSEPFDYPELRHTSYLKELGNEFYGSFLELDEHVRICDKSLPNVSAANLLGQVWPDAKFLALFRHCADFANSAIMASPWGMSGYGFDAYAKASPTNSVIGLIRYWMDRVQTIRAFARGNPHRCLGLRYEDLVGDTDGQLGRIWEFLELDSFSVDIGEGGFQEQQLRTPRDHKIRHARNVHSHSVGRGLRIPIADLAPATLLEGLNAELNRLSYVAIDRSWGCAEPKLQLAEFLKTVGGPLLPTWHDSESTTQPQSTADADWGAAEPSVKSVESPIQIEVCMTDGRTLVYRGEIRLPGGAITPAEQSTCDDAVVGTLMIGSEVLFAISVGYIDFGDAFRRGDIRYYAHGPDNSLRRAEDGEPIVDEIGDVIVNAARALLTDTQIERALDNT